MQMDLWVVAAATGAGYLAKYWKNVLGDKEGSLRSPRNSIPNVLRDQFLDETRKDDRLDELSSRNDGLFAKDIACGSGSVQERENYEFSEYRDEYDKYDYSLNVNMPEIPEYETWEMMGKHRPRINRKSSRSRHFQGFPLQYIKPRNSLNSFVMAQMNREESEIEEFLRTPLSSPCASNLRPFLVSDGNRVISKLSGDFRKGLDKEVLSKGDDDVLGIPHLPQIVTNGSSMKKMKNGKNQVGKSSNDEKSTQFYTGEGVSSGQALFCFGISIGVMSTLIANNMEVEKLKNRLKQSENLVEDLQEELEMKDSLTVKELVNDDDSQDILESSFCHENMNFFRNQSDRAIPIRYMDEESVSVDKFESISKIEAELEAELERLELSMAGSMLRERSNAIEELDPDVSAELVHGELNADIFGGKSSSDPTPDRGSTPKSVKDGVSPRDLSLRLHEVIESRLQERIMELEEELAKSRKKIQLLESEKNSWREVSQSESSSNLGSPVSHPLVMNLSGNALNAYNEVFGELEKLNGSRDGSDSWIQDDNRKQDVYPINSVINDKLTGFENDGKRDEYRRNECDDRDYDDRDGDDFDDDNDDDDDDDLLLIKQIVEKARQGSPALLKAQRSLIWSNIDDN